MNDSKLILVLGALGIRFALVIWALLAMAVCALSQNPAPPSIDFTAPVRKRAEALLQTIQQRQWTNCSGFVALQEDPETLRRMGVVTNANPESRTERIATWFKGLYERVPPGQVMSVRIRPENGRLALVTYMHEDLDAFYMRRIDGEWYYTLDEKVGGAGNGNLPGPFQQASQSFKNKIGFRTREAELLFPLITNGMHRAEVERILGKPKNYDGSDAAEPDADLWSYVVFYSQHLDVEFKDNAVVSATAVGFANRSKSSQ